MSKTFDVAIIGGGIIGSMVNYELSKYDLSITQLEKNNYVGLETSQGNSGVIHAGFDALETKQEAPLGVEGNNLWVNEIFPIFNFPWAKVPSLVIAFNKEEEEHLDILYKRGITNGLPASEMRIIAKEELHQLEPLLSEEATSALLAENSYAIDPVIAIRALLTNAIANGSEVQKNSEVIKIEEEGETFKLTLSNGNVVEAKNVINAAGHYADVIAKMAKQGDFKLTTKRGEYRVLSKTERSKVKNICFMVPTIHGKGVVAAPTLDGRILVGPTAEDGVPKDETRLVTPAMYDYIGNVGHKLIPDLDLEKTEYTYSGSRPIYEETQDFIIEYGDTSNKWISLGGMQSPALASSPAIAKQVANMLKDSGLDLKARPKYIKGASIVY